MIDAPGIYDLDAPAYHSDPCVRPSLSSSIVRVLLNQTPHHAWCAHPRLNPSFAAGEDEKFDVGTAAHVLMLNDIRSFAVCPQADWRKKEAQEFRAAAREAGKIPLLAEQRDRLLSMVSAGRRQLDAHEASQAFTAGKGEQTIVWREGDAWCRARLDYLRDARDVWDDYKTTTTADPDAWRRIAVAVGHDIQGAFYRRGIRALHLATDPVMRFVVQEVEEPFALCVMRMSEQMLELADRQVEQAIQLWRRCLSANVWPGYPAHVIQIEAPEWHEARIMDREIRRDGDARRHPKPTQEQLAAAMKAQAP